ncbi:hypothetical protein [Haliangium sp.]|uniref:hypothetical protein n=1 Tax=Haliangium sp. TaxID=2663208 RepID=UPI003D0B77DF
MKRGLVIHGVLLIAALAFAYQTWTREEVVQPVTGEVVVWTIDPDDIQAISFETTKNEAEASVVRLERRSDESGQYWWGEQTRILEQYTPIPAGAPDAAPEDDQPLKASEVATTRSFMVGEAGREAITGFAELRALRALGKADDELMETYELTGHKEVITVILDGESRRIALGGRVFGTRDRYGQIIDNGEVYVLSEELFRDLLNGEASLRMMKLHGYEDDDVAKVVIHVNGKERALVRTTVTDERGNEHSSWADAQIPDKADQTMANFLRTVGTLRPSRYEPELAPDSMKTVVRVEYQRGDGSPLGWVELYERPAAETDAPAETTEPAGDEETTRREKANRAVYYMRTERTRVPASVVYTTATRISEDIDQIFAQ